jgi:integrase/recombinase XerD
MPAAKQITEREFKRAIAQCSTRRHSTRDQTILHLSYLAGLRACEIAALTVSDVYSTDGAVRGSVTLGADQTKGHRARVFYVNQRLARVFTEYWRVVQSRDPHSPLFQTQQATAFSANTISQLFLHIYHAAGLDGCSSHSGRRSFITRLAEQGVAVHLLAALAGHRSIQTTQRYITVNDALLARAVELA